MLKNTLNKIFKKEKKDIVARSIADGYVDIKVYKQLEDGKEKLVYHDTGDNVVTNWMRSTILQLLSGKAFVADEDLPGSTRPGSAESSEGNIILNVLKPLPSDFSTVNKSAYILNGQQYLPGSISDFETKYGYGIYDGGTGMKGNYIYPVFPTKVLFGTGKEYNSWQTLKAEHSTTDPDWYAEMISLYGDGDETTAKDNWNLALSNTDDPAGKYNANAVSSFIGNEDVHTGEGTLIPGITVNDPNTGYANDNNTNDFANYYSVIGPVKTCHIGLTDEKAMSTEGNSILDGTISTSGRLITGKYRGAGKPAFIYFDKSTTTTDVNLKADTSIKYNNKIEYRIVMPSQGAGTGDNGKYYPYNGWQLKQIGLYNDAILPAVNSNTSERNAMPSGTLLAIKNISPFTKTGDEKVVLTWTLTI